MLRALQINGYLCRVWYRGQPIVSNLCNVQGRKTAVCPNKDKCCHCGEQGHFARNCSKNLDPSLASSGDDLAVSSVPSGVVASADPIPEGVVSAYEEPGSNLASDGCVQNDGVVQNNERVSSDEVVQNGGGFQNGEVVQNDEGVQNAQNEEDIQVVQNEPSVQTADEGDRNYVSGENDDFRFDLRDDLERMSGDADKAPCPSADECQSENDTVSSKPVGEVNVDRERRDDTSNSADSASYANVVQEHSGPLVDTPGATSGGEGSIMEFSESSESQSILGPKAPPVSYSSRNLQGKAGSSVILKLQPRKQPVVRTGHHSLPAVVSNRPTVGVKTKKRSIWLLSLL